MVQSITCLVRNGRRRNDHRRVTSVDNEENFGRRPTGLPNLIPFPLIGQKPVVNKDGIGAAR